MADSRDYFQSVIKPLLRQPYLDFIGEIGQEEKSAFLGGARALLFPIDWPEPFGLVMIEALACGTPVIAFDHGSVREVIEDGRSGYIVNDFPSAIEAVQKIDRLARTASWIKTSLSISSDSLSSCRTLWITARSVDS
jgi:glycosyltransferase involved in cell wall biosynthesis